MQLYCYLRSNYSLLLFKHQEAYDLFKNGPNPASFCLFSFFSQHKYIANLILNYESVYGVLGTGTQGGKKVGEDKSTELWWQPVILLIVST